jgi:hypothetical protein
MIAHGVTRPSGRLIGAARAALVMAAVLFPLATGAPATAAPATSAPATSATTTAPAFPAEEPGALPAPVEVLVSTDGAHFTPGLRGALFGTGGALVPGAAVSANLWVRNPTAFPVALQVSARDVLPTSPDFAAAVALTAWENGAGEGAQLPLSAIAPCDVLLEPRVLQPGETRVFHLRFAMADVSGSTGQREAAALTLVVAMRDTEAGAVSESGCGVGVPGLEPVPDGTDDAAGGSAAPSGTVPTGADSHPSSTPRGSLAYTGGGPEAPILLVGSLLIGAGAALVTARRRRSRTDG